MIEQTEHKNKLKAAQKAYSNHRQPIGSVNAFFQHFFFLGMEFFSSDSVCCSFIERVTEKNSYMRRKNRILSSFMLPLKSLFHTQKCTQLSSAILRKVKEEMEM